ncbi:MAG: cyclase family protein [Betaproteobacteria bacterium]|nr:cyclase family protein [Betaproteobacteria bacterium]NBS48198.1 cyclase family protein [Betaproteobacteria bacterium]
MKLHTLRTLLIGGAIGLFASSAALAQADWCKSKWGPNDEIGAANLLTPQLAAEAAKLVKTGKTYALGYETNAGTAAYAPRTWSLTVLQPGQAGGVSLGGTKTTYNDDIYMGWVGTGSQLDGLGHIGVDNVYYNCNKNSDFVQANGLKKLGIEKVPPFVTRGIVLDMTAYYGKDVVPEGTAFNRKEIDEQARRQGIEIRKGDVVLFHTGWGTLEGKDNKRFLAGEPGLGKDGALYLASKEVIAVGADSWALEVIPFEPGVGVFEVHQILLARNGIYILENMNVAPLAKDKAWEFMFVLGASRITGGVQAIINPVAIR